MSVNIKKGRRKSIEGDTTDKVTISIRSSQLGILENYAKLYTNRNIAAAVGDGIDLLAGKLSKIETLGEKEGLFSLSLVSELIGKRFPPNYLALRLVAWIENRSVPYIDLSEIRQWLIDNAMIPAEKDNDYSIKISHFLETVKAISQNFYSIKRIHADSYGVAVNLLESDSLSCDSDKIFLVDHINRMINIEYFYIDSWLFNNKELLAKIAICCIEGLFEAQYERPEWFDAYRDLFINMNIEKIKIITVLNSH